MITLVNKTDFYEYYGLSTDNKPMDCPNGSQFIEIDTGKIYLFDSNNIAWYEGIGGGGGSGGTSDYTNLQNKPQINGVTLSGNKTTGDLSILPTASWTATVSVSFTNMEVTVEVDGVSYTKTSDKFFTASQLDGAVFRMQTSAISIDSEDLTDLSSKGITGTLINVGSFGNVVISCEEAGSVISEPGFYLATALITYASVVTLSYTESLTAQTHAIGIGNMEMEDGVTDLPTGVIWLQYES